MAILTILGLLLLKLSLNVLHPRQWALQQSVTDAYLTYERAYAQRVPFDMLTAEDSPWPVFPEKSEENVELGRLPGNRVIEGKIFRFRTPDAGNLMTDEGSGDDETNPAAMRIWKLQSVLSYEIGGREYVKSRTVVRSQ